MFPFLNPSVILENVKRGNHKGTDFIECRCVACAAEGGDSTNKNHLRIYKTGAFVCQKYPKEGKDATDHNRLIRRLIRRDSGDDTTSDIVFVDPDPTIEIDMVYPESVLAGLLPDHSYWEGRGINIEVVQKLEGGFAPSTTKGKLSNRYVFPIRSTTGRIMGFSGRLVSDNSFAPKWKHLFRSSRACYPYSLAIEAIRRTKRVVFVESIGNLLTLHQLGIYEVIVLFGLVLNSRVLSTLIALNPSRFIIACDNDRDFGDTEKKRALASGNRAAEKVQRRLGAFFSPEKITIRMPLAGNDWNSTTPEELATFKGEVEG